LNPPAQASTAAKDFGLTNTVFTAISATAVIIVVAGFHAVLLIDAGEILGTRPVFAAIRHATAANAVSVALAAQTAAGVRRSAFATKLSLTLRLAAWIVLRIDRHDFAAARQQRECKDE